MILDISLLSTHKICLGKRGKNTLVLEIIIARNPNPNLNPNPNSRSFTKFPRNDIRKKSCICNTLSRPFKNHAKTMTSIPPQLPGLSHDLKKKFQRPMKKNNNEKKKQKQKQKTKTQNMKMRSHNMT